MIVYVDAACDIHYSSYYIYGLQQCFSKKNVKFSSKYFKDFGHNNHFFAFVIVSGSELKKYIVDFTDSSDIDGPALDWCHCYGKVNFEKGSYHSHKIIPLGPSFGIRIFDLPITLYLSGINLFKSYKRVSNKRRFLADYKSQFKRPKYEDYFPGDSKDNYVFFMGSLWKKEPWTNKFRANFIRACIKNPEINFEGGFPPRTKNDIEGYETLTAPMRIDMKSYLTKTKSSMLVFNTPAVKDCHGWKLAEYLCLGKVIISTPLSREIPGNLGAESEIIICDGSKEDIQKNLNGLLNNKDQRLQYENAARRYFLEHLSPEKVVNKLLAHNCG